MMSSARFGDLKPWRQHPDAAASTEAVTAFPRGQRVLVARPLAAVRPRRRFLIDGQNVSRCVGH
jgi:hypothetical protein